MAVGHVEQKSVGVIALEVAQDNKINDQEWQQLSSAARDQGMNSGDVKIFRQNLLGTQSKLPAGDKARLEKMIDDHADIFATMFDGVSGVVGQGLNWIQSSLFGD